MATNAVRKSAEIIQRLNQPACDVQVLILPLKRSLAASRLRAFGNVQNLGLPMKTRAAIIASRTTPRSVGSGIDLMAADDDTARTGD